VLHCGELNLFQDESCKRLGTGDSFENQPLDLFLAWCKRKGKLVWRFLEVGIPPNHKEYNIPDYNGVLCPVIGA
jgi:hypothetical protein